jgi:cbb3-type cytochrome oxidase maturation protein
MSILFIAVPIALLLAAGAVAACIWAIRSGQYEDLETPAIRMLFEDTQSTSTPRA